MEKRTLFAVVLTVVLGIGAYAALRTPDKGDRKGPPPRPIAAMKAADVTKLEIVSQKDEHTTLEKKGGAWRVTAPSDWRADQAAVKALTDGIEKLSFGDIVTENAAKQTDLGVADKGSIHLKVTTATGTTEMILGQSVGGFTMLRQPGKNEVWQAASLFPYTANKGPREWRDHSIIDLPAADVEKLSVEVPGGSKLVLDRAKPDAAADPKAPTMPAKWTLLESTGDAPKAGDLLDPSQPMTVASAMQALRAADFADGKSAKEAGLEPPALVVTLSGKGKSEGLEVSATQGEDAYVRKVGEPTIYMAKKYMLDRIVYRPIDYRDKTLLHYKADEIERLRVAQGKDETVLAQKDGKWQLPAGVTDAGKATALLGGVESLQGASFLTDKTVKTELDKPRALITVELKGGKKAVLRIGGLTKDSGDYYVQREGSSDVLLAKKFAIDRVLKKPTDLAPSPAMPPGHPGGPPGPMPPGMMKKLQVGKK